ncbi:MAG: hypothetical protein HDS41_01485 [Bacteroides sp.]|nr:hypothetical protein [Bacteroides sp.]
MSALIILVSCDEGRLYGEDVLISQEGGNARIIATVAGLETWSEQYTLAVAGFEDGNEFALISKNIEPTVTDGKCDVVLTGIPPEVSTVELCAIDRLRRRVATFASSAYVIENDTLMINITSVDLSMSKAIQKEIFNTTCIQCHGGSNHIAAGLNLIDGESFSNMITVPSVKVPDMNRVQPGNSASSVLYLILSESASSTWSYDHSVEIVRQEKLDLIRNWIDGGAIL